MPFSPPGGGYASQASVDAVTNRVAVLGLGGAGELTPLRAAAMANLPNLDRAISALKQSASFFNVYAASNQPVGAILATTGPLPAGDYEVAATFSLRTPQARTVALQHRDAANAADVHIFTSGDQVVVSYAIYWPRVTLAQNERIQLQKMVADIAGGVTDWSIFVRPA